MKILAVFTLVIVLAGPAWGADIFIEPFEEPPEVYEYLYEDVPDSENPLFNFRFDDSLTGQAWEKQAIIVSLRIKYTNKYLSHPDEAYAIKMLNKLDGCYPGSRKEKVGFCKPVKTNNKPSSVQQQPPKEFNGAVKK